MASQKGHLDVVNRLLDCKEIEVNAKTRVSGNVDFAPSGLPKFWPYFGGWGEGGVKKKNWVLCFQ